MVRRRSVNLLLLATVLALASEVAFAQEPEPLWVAVTTSSLEGALRPLVEKRAADGFETVVSTRPVAAALKELPRRPSRSLQS